VAEGGRSVTLAEIADIAAGKMPDMVRNENGDLSGYVYVDVDISSVTAADYVEGAQHFPSENLSLPTGYFLEWTGDYQYAARARQQLQLIVPLT
jgi:copper/silver efflux system protein